MEEAVARQEAGDSEQDSTFSFTQLSKRMLEGPAELVPWKKAGAGFKVEAHTDSIYEIASRCGKTLVEYVRDDPELACLEAEASHAAWSNLLTQVALTGCVSTEDGTVEVTKNQMKAVELRTRQAKEEAGYVFDCAMSLAAPGDRKREHLLRSLYVSAVMRKDTRALIYLIDRVEGRPGESRVAELNYDNAYNIYMIIHTLFDKQLEVLNAGNGTHLICCSRRAGKTHLLVAASLIECLRMSNTTCIYIGETMELTENLIEQAANEIVEKCHLQDRKGRRFNWRRMDNGSQILVRGLSNTKDPDQIRGNKAKVIVIDEFFHLKSDLLDYLQTEVLQPMQMDYADDYKFICAGTPPRIKGTYGERAWKTWEVPHFQWTWRDNPHPVSYEARAAYVEKVMEEKGLTWDAPYMRREYNGEWAYDDDLVLYPNVKVYDPLEGIPQWPVSRVLFGLDYGVSDCDTVIGIAWSDGEGKGYEFYSSKFSRLDIKDRNMSQLEYLKDRVREAWELALQYFGSMSPAEANKRVFWDADDNDQHITEELAMNVVREYEDSDGKPRKLTLNIRNAHKTDKKIMWDKIDELMRTGRLLLVKGGKTAMECVSTILLRGEHGEIYDEIDDKAYHPDLLPAMRYALANVLL